MMTNLCGVQDLDGWLAAVEADDIPELATFARGIRQDYAAVRNGLSLPHNSGACEGNVNRLKALKRQMFGRAGLDLLPPQARHAPDLLTQPPDLTHRHRTTKSAAEPMTLASDSGSSPVTVMRPGESGVAGW
jgi:hypothetical protein